MKWKKLACNGKALLKYQKRKGGEKKDISNLTELKYALLSHEDEFYYCEKNILENFDKIKSIHKLLNSLNEAERKVFEIYSK